MSILIKNASIYPISSAPLCPCDLFIDHGKIQKIAPHIHAPANPTVQIIDATGQLVFPGFIEPHCHIGITEERKGMDGDDCNECTTPITPYLRGLDAINPLDAAFSKAVAAGITSVMAGPGSSNVIGGQFVFLKTAGSRCVDDLIVRQPAAMKAAFGENPKTQYGDQNLMPSTRMGIASMIREELTRARQYWQNRCSSSQTDLDFRLECWIPVFEKQIPLKCHAHRADDIFTALRIAREFDLDITLDHCSEGHLIAPEIAASGFPAIIGPDLASRNKIETENMAFKTAGILQKSGVTVSITTDHPVSLIQSLPLCAALAAKNGLGTKEALRAITLNAAKICRVDDRVGSLEVGKDADIVIFDQSPFETFSHCLMTIIDGEIVFRADSICH